MSSNYAIHENRRGSQSRCSICNSKHSFAQLWYLADDESISCDSVHDYMVAKLLADLHKFHLGGMAPKIPSIASPLPSYPRYFCVWKLMTTLSCWWLWTKTTALDSDDLLYLKEQMEAEEDAERLRRRTEKRAFAAFKISSVVSRISPSLVYNGHAYYRSLLRSTITGHA